MDVRHIIQRIFPGLETVIGRQRISALVGCHFVCGRIAQHVFKSLAGQVILSQHGNQGMAVFDKILPFRRNAECGQSHDNLRGAFGIFGPPARVTAGTALNFGKGTDRAVNRSLDAGTACIVCQRLQGHRGNIRVGICSGQRPAPCGIGAFVDFLGKNIVYHFLP